MISWTAFSDELLKLGGISTPSAVRAAVEKFCKERGLDPKKAMLVGGASMFMHGLRPEINDVDMYHPQMTRMEKGYVDGFEIDAGDARNLTPGMLRYEVKHGVRVQTLPALLEFYKSLNREKDQPRIALLRERLGS
jgi:hypothetical protein